MIRLLSLILPVLIPSWRFFAVVDPSPRVQWQRAGEAEWHAFRPTPARTSPLALLRQLVWNPAGNDTLFVVSCAERIERGPDPIAVRAIAARIAAGRRGRLRFRLVFVHHDGARLVEDVVFTSDPFAA